MGPIPSEAQKVGKVAKVPQKKTICQVSFSVTPSPRNLTACPWKMDGWKMSFPFGKAYFEGRNVKFQGCNCFMVSRWFYNGAQSWEIFCAVSGFLGAAGDSFFSQNFWFGSHSVRLRWITVTVTRCEWVMKINWEPPKPRNETKSW